MTSRPEGPIFVRPRVAAGVLFLDQDDRVLLVVPSYKDFLDLPGGYVEPGESPSGAAQREVREELAIEPAIGRLLVADWRHDSGDDDGGEKLLLVFDGGHLTPDHLGAISVDGEEVVDYRWHTIAELDSVTIPRLVNRIQHAVAAHHEGTTRYLEDGDPIGSVAQQVVNNRS